MTSPSLSLRDVRKAFGPIEVLHGIDFDLHPGEVHALIGENGAGKSTIMKILGGFLQPSSGAVLLDGAPGAGDNTAFGRVAGEYFKANLKSGAKVVVLRGIPTTLDNERVAAFEAAIDGSGIEVLDKQHGNWNRDDAFQVMQDYLSKYPHIDAVWAADDDMAIGVQEAIAQAGRTKEMWIIGGAGMKEIVKRIMEKDPQFPVDVTYPPALISAAIEMTALRFVSDTPVYGRFIIGSTLITPENAERFYFPDSPF